MARMAIGLSGWIVGALTPVLALAQAAAEPPPLPKACLDEAKRLLAQNEALHDGVHKARMPAVAGADLARLERLGEVRGRLDGPSFITPASTYRLVVLPPASADDRDEACPLHRAYVQFRQGGFVPQPPSYHGPLRPRS